MRDFFITEVIGFIFSSWFFIKKTWLKFGWGDGHE